MSSTIEYYELLGVAKTASTDEIKKAYRKKAFELHPDRNPGDQAAEESFKIVSEAYEVLSDDRRRQIYDQFGHAGLKGGAGGFHPFTNTDDIFSAFSDIFEDFFGFDSGRGRGGSGRQRARRGQDLQIEVSISFLDACVGVEREVDVSSNVSCTACEGNGAKKGTHPTKCTYCNGYGQVQMSQGFFTMSTNCPQCNGNGHVIKDKCPECRGKGVVPQSRKLKVKIPAGIADQMRLVLRGEGEKGQNGGPAGDLYVFTRVTPHPEFRREEDNILSDVDVPFPHLVLGSKLTINTIDGPREIDLKAGTASGDVVCLEKCGIPNLRNGRRGDHLIHLRGVVPPKLSARQKELLEELAQEFPLSKPVVEPESKPEKGKKKKKGFFSQVMGFC